MSRPVYVSGRLGAGKSSLAFPLAAELGYSLVTKDLVKETLHDALFVPGEDELDQAWSRRLDFIVRNSGDRLYDIKCPGGHYTLKTAPQITKAIRRAAGDQVSLA